MSALGGKRTVCCLQQFQESRHCICPPENSFTMVERINTCYIETTPALSEPKGFGVRKVLFVALFIFLPCLSQAQPAWRDVRTLQQNGNFVKIIITKEAVPVDQVVPLFVDEFWLKWSSPNTIALPYMSSVVGDSLDFYGKSTSHAEFMKAQVAFTNRWPNRQYWIQPGSETIDCGSGTKLCTVDGIVNWEDFSQAQNTASSGSAKFKFSLQWQINAADSYIFQIVAESGSVISRATGGQSNFASPPLKGDDQNHNQLVTDAALQAAGCISEDSQTIQHESCKSLREIDLKKVFHTKDKVVFEAIQATYGNTFPPPVNFCFIHQYRIQCQNALAGGGPDNTQWLASSDSLLNTSLVYPTAHAYYPVLHGQTELAGGMGCGGVFNFVWAYDPASSDFKLIWANPFDCHSTLQFETSGPLAGDVVAVDNDVTGHWPWPYGIEVYKFLPPDQLVKRLYIVGRAGQGGKYVSGPEDAIGIDMPEILYHLSNSQ
jgi:hypothetical protein